MATLAAPPTWPGCKPGIASGINSNRQKREAIVSLKDPNVVNSRKQKRVAIVLSNPAISTTTGWPVGFWWSELSHPYFFLNEKGYGVDIFSPEGGKCEADAMSDPRDPSGYSDADIVSLGFISTPRLPK